jgi:very-short-patch-repair endonuclease
MVESFEEFKQRFSESQLRSRMRAVEALYQHYLQAEAEKPVPLEPSGPRMTDIEQCIKGLLEEIGIEYAFQYRHHAARLWPMDFWLPAYSVDLECDGEYWHSQPEAILRDLKRNELMAELGVTVLRIPGRQCRDLDSESLLMMIDGVLS